MERCCNEKRIGCVQIALQKLCLLCYLADQQVVVLYVLLILRYRSHNTSSDAICFYVKEKERNSIDS